MVASVSLGSVLPEIAFSAGGERMRVQRAAAVTLTMLVMAFPAPIADAKVRTLYTPPASPTIDPLDAVAVIASRNGYSYVGWVCDPNRFVPTTRWAATGSNLTINCPDGTPVTASYAPTTGVAVARDSKIRGIYVFVYRSAPPFTVTLGFTEEDRPAADKFADAWRFLALSRALVDPASDAAFQAQLVAERAQSVNPEDLRRTQVQIETMVREGRTLDAARMCRDRLKTAALWAEGHYNMALIYGDLELYPEAINAMRRYLHLAPNATNARAVRDQVYRWEALIAR